MHITILGAGAYGRALAEILKNNHHAIQFFDPYKFPTVSLHSALIKTEVIILATPTDVATKLLAFIPKQCRQLPLICATKGLLDFDLIHQFPRFSVFAGPAFASTLSSLSSASHSDRHPIPITVTSALAGHLFRHPALTFQNTADETGVLLCSALKNLYAFHSGTKHYAEKPTSRTFNRFILAAHQETKLVLKHHHCNPATAHLACGLDDLILTAASAESRNYRLGAAFADDNLTGFLSSTPTVESLTTVIKYHALFNVENTPLLHDIITTIKTIHSKLS